MSNELGEQLKKAKSSEALSLINSLLDAEDAPSTGVNSWLYLYEILYAQIRSANKEDLGYAEAAVAILSHLESMNSSDMNSFLVQELSLRALLIKTYGLGSGLLDPEYIFSAVKIKLGDTNPESIPDNWQFLYTHKEIAMLRNIKNLLGPVSSLKEIGIENNFCSNWLLVRGQLP